jgi:hypothetical protein
LIVAELTGSAQRHARWRDLTGAETADAVAELQQIADGRGDLLAEVAGLLLGAREGALDEATAKSAARLCIQAGADIDQLARWVTEGQRRAEIARMMPHSGQPLSQSRRHTYLMASNHARRSVVRVLLPQRYPHDARHSR